MYNHLFISAVILLTITVSGCSKEVLTSGYVIKNQQIEKISIGTHDKNDVLRILGSPSVMGTFNDNRWYYMQAQRTNKTLSSNTEAKREIVIIEFGKDGRVASLNLNHGENGRHIKPNSKVTPTQGQSLGIIDQMLDNVGRVGN